MPADTKPRSNPDPWLRGLHWGVLALLVGCMGLILLGKNGVEESAPERWLASTCIGIAVVTIVCRRLGSSPRIRRPAATMLLVVSLLGAASLGVLGTVEALLHGGTQTGLLFTLAGLIFALRGPGQLGQPSNEGPGLAPGQGERAEPRG